MSNVIYLNQYCYECHKPLKVLDIKDMNEQFLLHFCSDELDIYFKNPQRSLTNG